MPISKFPERIHDSVFDDPTDLDDDQEIHPPSYLKDADFVDGCEAKILSDEELKAREAWGSEPADEESYVTDKEIKDLHDDDSYSVEDRKKAKKVKKEGSTTNFLTGQPSREEIEGVILNIPHEKRNGKLMELADTISEYFGIQLGDLRKAVGRKHKGLNKESDWRIYGTGKAKNGGVSIVLLRLEGDYHIHISQVPYRELNPETGLMEDKSKLLVTGISKQWRQKEDINDDIRPVGYREVQETRGKIEENIGNS